MRDLLVDYLRERQISIDHVSLVRLADTLGRLFWRDLETHHPGIASLRLPPPVTAAWKQRIFTKTIRRTRPDGSVEEMRSSRESATNCLSAVRTFYLDIAQWATDDPARWARWAVPCPIKAGEIPHRRVAVRRKSRMDQRTRERLPILPALVAAVDTERTAAAERLVAAEATKPGEVFTVGGLTLRRSGATRRQVANIWAEDPAGGRRRNLTMEEHRAFWAWAAVEVLRHTGIRIEELTELTHPSVVEYRLPTTGELVPLLHVAPSKTDAERLLVVSPELADVLSVIIRRVRGPAGAVPLVVATTTTNGCSTRPCPSCSSARSAPEPPDHRPGDPQAARHGARRDRPHPDRRPAAAVRSPRLPTNLHHRRRAQRHAAPHRPAGRRTRRHQHHHGLQGRLQRRSHHRTPGVHRPSAGHQTQ